MLDAERAHNLALASAAGLSSSGWLCRGVRSIFVNHDSTPITLAGLTFPNRVGLAAGMDKNARAPLAWWAFGFGFLELGTITPLPQIGNPGTRMFRRVADRSILNRMGFNNDGATAVAARLKQMTIRGLRPSIPIGISVGKNKDTPNADAATDYARSAEILAPHADFLSINVSSPNTTDLRALQTGAAITELVVAVKAVSAGKPIFVKVAPELTGPILREVLDASLAAGATGIIATNTRASVTPKGDPCGESGLPLKIISRQRVAEIRAHLGPNVPLIGCGGIDDLASARAMRDAGADLIQLYSALVYEGPLLPATLAAGLG